MYSIDYFVNQEWKIFISKPIWVEMWVDLWIDDYFNAVIHASHDIEKQVNANKLKAFVESCVRATNICNTYIHHEFKITSKWEYKTIEMNGRIWGSRVEHMLEAYGLNLYEYILWKAQKHTELIQNFIKINVYAHQRGILTGINHELIQKLKMKKSTNRISVWHKHVGKVTWLTKDWFTRIIVIKLRHKNIKIIKKDLQYIKKHYKHFLQLEDESKFIEMVNYIKTLWYTLVPTTKKKK
jgi:PIN domain nuclease of toxin-antitoxin system